MVRRFVTLACLLFAARAFADGARVRWLGITAEGRAPAALEKAATAHVAVALRQLGLTLVTLPPSSADVTASCGFNATRVARCRVEVQSSSGARAERHAQIPFHDADDLAESLALLVSDLLTTQFPEVLSPPPPEPPSSTQPITPPEAHAATPQPAPPPKPVPRPPKRDLEAERQRQAAEERARQEELARQADYEARARGLPSRTSVRFAPSRLAIEVALAGVFTIGPANPTIGGALVRVLWAGGPLRAGGSLSLGGSAQTAGAYKLGWFRGLLAARVGAGVARHGVDFDATAGPALLVAYADAHADGHHAFPSLGFVVGPHLYVDVGRHVALALGADLQVAVTSEKVVAGSTRVAQLSNVAIEGALGLAWRR